MMHQTRKPTCWESAQAATPRPDRSIGFPARLRQHGPALLAAAALLAAGTTAARADPIAAATDVEAARPCTSPSDPGRPRILVTVSGARRVAGNITFTLYGDQPARFLAHKGSIAIERVTLSTTGAQGCFVVSRPGAYAVAVYHDENNNHHFDRSLIGLPVEGYGFSRNAPIFMAPPSFNAVRFDAGNGDTSLAIALRY